MALMHPKPVKAPKAKISEAELQYLRAVKQLPCVCCGLVPSDAHHVMCGRYSQRKTPHWHAIPLCDRHHQGQWDTRGPAFHRERELWVEQYGQDTDYTKETQRKIAAGFGLVVPVDFRV